MDMANTAYEICDYKISKLKSILSQNSDASIDILNNKLILTYFENYFEHLKAKKIIVENNYIDRDFLNDFCGYYVRCFNKYKRECTRLHFFNKYFTIKEFDALLRGEKSKIDKNILNEAYLGFVVVKPLPQTIIGRTCLKTYGSDNNRRNFPIIRDYEANLFGVKLNVKTLAFQEQDRVVAACATSALWSIFQETGKLFQHIIPSPVDITKIACDPIPLENRSLPNTGLTVTQMAHAIRTVGLEPLLIKADNEEIFKSAVYAYIKGGIPVLMVVALVDESNVTRKNDQGELKDFHAVSIAGYSTGLQDAIPYKHSGILLKASRIDRVYAHDDQVGPFARMVLDQKEISYLINGKRNTHKSLHTSWRGENNKIGSMRAVPITLLIPVYHKIRIPFDVIQEKIIQFDSFLEILRAPGFINVNQRIEWDIFLTTINAFKSDLFQSEALQTKLKKEILTASMPRFLWRAKASCEEKCLIDLVFDATEIEQGLTLNRAIGYEEDLFKTIVRLSKIKDISDRFKEAPVWDILGWFSNIKLKQI
jgi:hypothetical protein